ncbi:gamma-glutamylcyclotransferase family protein [Roseibium algae]|uniref:Gamma-glutamylcyclotransferase family protein n=1 Tax=Roseibium algae TaxID=3123038 RepID=A0ABU8TPI3_9HYPH
MTITYFGYGSLVNIETLSKDTSVSPGTLTGWVREWRIQGGNSFGRSVCALGVVPDKDTSIRGVAAREPKEGLAKLDLREDNYYRVADIGADFHCDELGQPGADDMFLYRSKPENYGWGSDEHPILQSYLDCVLAGFHAFWGEDGITHFIETTRGWHVPILAERDAPIYPRSIQLTAELKDMIDSHLLDQKVRYISLK